MNNKQKPKHVFLIDGSGFIFRAFHGLPPMSREDGTNSLLIECHIIPFPTAPLLPGQPAHK